VTKYQEVFDLAIKMMDEQSLTTGQAVHDQTREYQQRALAIMGIKVQELSDESPILPRSYEDEVPLSDKIARGILPYGLAGELYLHEDPDASNYYLSKYVSLIRDLNRRAVSERIRDVYHGIGHDEFARW
jgi:hypothetical protein